MSERENSIIEEKPKLKNGLISRDFTSEDCSRLPRLMEKVWKTRTSKEYWEWKFFKPPFETKGMVVENRKGDIIAFVSSWLRPTKCGGRTITPAMLVDVMADPEYRGLGIYGHILKRIQLELERPLGVFGFTNPVSHRMFGKFFRDSGLLGGNIPIFQSLINVGVFSERNKWIYSIARGISRSIHKLRLAFTNNKNIFVQQVKIIDDDFDQLWADVNAEYFWIQDRGRKFVEWRFMQDPMREYQIWKAKEGDRPVGYLVTTINPELKNTRGVIGDWLVSRKRNDVFRALLSAAFNWFVDHKVDLVDAWLMDHEKQWARILKSYFFVKRRRARSFLLIPNLGWGKSNFPEVKNLYFTIGDSDYSGIQRG